MSLSENLRLLNLMILILQDVCETRISYENKKVKEIWKGCDTSAWCDRKKSGSLSVCTSTYFLPYCVYCCDTALCNKDIELLTFKGEWVIL